VPTLPKPRRRRRKKARRRRKKGRYQIAVVDDARDLLNETGKPGSVLKNADPRGARLPLQGRLPRMYPRDGPGRRDGYGGALPPKIGPPFLGDDVLAGKPDALDKEGYVVLLGMIPEVPIEQALEPLHPHLGAMFTLGPAGPLHGLVPYFLRGRRQARISAVSVCGTAEKQDRAGLRHVGEPQAADPQPPGRRGEGGSISTPAHTTEGKNFEAGKETEALRAAAGLERGAPQGAFS